MQAHQLPARYGWTWISGGFRLFRRNPPVLGFLVFGYWFLLLLLDMVPVLGPVLAALCVPAMSVSVMNGCRIVEEEGGKRPEIGGVLLSGFRRHGRTLATLGGLNLVCWLVVLAISSALDGGNLMQAFTSGKVLDEDMMRDSRVQFAMLTTLLFMVPVLMAFWFAPLLVAWDNCGAAKAMFFSFVACRRNGGAFLTYGLGLMLVSGVLPGLFLGLLAAISSTLVAVAAAALTLPLLLVFVPTLFASFYVSYKQVFAAGEVAAAAVPRPDDEDGLPPPAPDA